MQIGKASAAGTGLATKRQDTRAPSPAAEGPEFVNERSPVSQSACRVMRRGWKNP